MSSTSSCADICIGSFTRLVEAEVDDHGVEVGVGGSAPRSRSASSCALMSLVTRAHQHPDEREPLLLVEASGDAEVEERDAALIVHEQVARRAGRRGRRRRASRPRAS